MARTIAATWFGYMSALGVIATVVSGAAVHALETPLAKGATESLLDLSIEELMEIQVSIATRRTQKITEAPSTVTVFSETDIRRLGVHKLEDLLNYVPGVYTNRTDHISRSAVFRGRRTGSVSPDVLVLLDGMRMNDPVGGGVFETTPEINLNFIERVEVIRGPGSALYGSNAQSGVINLVPKTTGNEIYGIIGDHGTYDAGVFWGQPIGKTTITTSARYGKTRGETYDPFYDFFGENFQTRDPISEMDLSGRAAAGGLTLTADYFYRNKKGFVSGGGLNYIDDHLRTKTKNLFLRASYVADINDALNAEAYATYHRIRYSFTTRLFPADFSAANIWSNGANLAFIGGNTRASKEIETGLNLTWTPSDRHVVSFGSSVHRQSTGRVSFQGNFDGLATLNSNGADVIPLSEPGLAVGFYGGPGAPFTGEEIYLLEKYARNVFHMYLQDEFAIAEKLSLTSGIRYDSYEDTGSKITFRGGVVFQPFSETVIKALFGQAFRAPTISEQRSEISSSIVGNPDLQPETNNSFEFSASHRFENIKVTATFFTNRIQDSIQNVLVEEILPGFNSFQPQNVHKQSHRGLELEVVGRLASGLDISAGFTHLLKYDDIAVPKNIAFWALNYNHNRWNLNVNGFFRSSIPSLLPVGDGAFERISLDSFSVWNGHINYSVTDSAEVFFEVSNIFAKSYVTYSEIAGLERGTPAPRRMMRLGFRFLF
ncbi:receptor [Kordiimonas sediminis]|uniref:Receptor n=1 Tax=Kordiimonas sediminis TaxID=1735581 RepID=A0A919AP15_9PROT|nr:TonB-dependent receptor [Kordiimonas sediminis]GHF17867.1 receptor [Kordiimonas sediminis]